MRLGQLARKLAIKPFEIVEFLASNSIQIEEGSNTRIEDNHVKMIIEKFAPATLKQAVIPVVYEAPKVMAPPLQEESAISLFDKPVVEEPNLMAEEPKEKVSPVEVITPPLVITGEEKSDVIKAPKIALSGLKVLGKVDFAPKKKEPQIEEPSIEAIVPSADIESKPDKEDSKEDSKERKVYSDRRPKPEQRPRRNPIALEREREAIEAEKKKLAQSEHIKRKRTENYLKKVKIAPPTKSAKLLQEPVFEMTEKDLTDVPEGWWNKFLKWLKD